ncbi:MAG TPA: hypothetical protein VIH99_07535 [Bdellovibrionota bacterium]|jgi:hypothetical protein
MKNFYLAAFLTLLFLSSSGAWAAASATRTGIGATIGNPLGITGRTWFNEENSFDYGLGWGISDSRRFHVYADYLWNKADAFDMNDEPFDFFFGGGLAMRTNSGRGDSETVIGPRLPVGVSYEFAKPKLELFLAGALNMGLLPSSDFWVDIHVGARFYLF